MLEFTIGDFMFIATSSIALILIVAFFALASIVAVPVLATFSSRLYVFLRDWNTERVMRAEAFKQAKLETAKLEEQLLNEQLRSFVAEKPWPPLQRDHE
jgi:hypothetical protein